jgi:hypothetical protein
MGVKIQGNKIYLPKLGWMRFYNSRSVPDGFTIKACAVRKRQNGWFLSIRIENKSVPDYIAKALEDVVKVIGCDLGIAKLVHQTSCKNPFHQLMGRVLRPIPQELFFLVGWAEEPVLFIFARGLSFRWISD